MESPIGSFLLKGDDTDDHDGDRLSLALPSLWRDVVAPVYRHHHRRLLLQGPHSMTSSLLFDHAIYVASKEPCRCRYNNSNSSALDFCRCVAVTVIRSTTRRDDSFPIRCRPRTLKIESTKPNDDFSTLNNTDTSRFRHAFRRIQIIYVNGIQDILQYLLTIASQPGSHQPWGGIFLDQLDDILVQQYQECREDVDAMVIRMSQTVAILMDTVSFLEKTHCCAPTILVTVQGDSDTSTFVRSTNHRFQCTSSFWSPLYLTLVPAVFEPTTGSSNKSIEDTETVQSVFHLTAPDAIVIAVLITFENFEKEVQIVWTSAIDEPSISIHKKKKSIK